MPTAVVSMPLVTPVQDEPTAERTAERLRDIAEAARAMAPCVERLAQAGWELIPPEAVKTDAAYVDIFLAFLKDFPDAEAAERDAKACLPPVRTRPFNADLGWNANREHPQGPAHYEAVEWWTEL